MKIILNIKLCLILLLPLLFFGCKEDSNRLMYSDDPEVYFYKGDNTLYPDSLDYTFILKPDDVFTDTVQIPLRISGFSAQNDRVVNIEVGAESTAEVGRHFKIDPVIIKAGAYSGTVPLVLLRSEDLKEKQLRIYLKIANSAGFEPGYADRLNYLVKITDQLSRPEDWETFIFGQYSQKKHQFMVASIGHIRVAMSLGAQFSELFAILQTVRVELIKYEAINGPMYDENGNRVTFPSL